jgi:hypothetical protein
LILDRLSKEHIKTAGVSLQVLRALEGGWIETAQMLLDLESPEHKAQYAGKQLEFAVKRGQVDAVKLLIDVQGSYLKEPPELYSKAYLWAVSHGYTSIVRLLDEYDCNSATHLHGSSDIAYYQE